MITREDLQDALHVLSFELEPNLGVELVEQLLAERDEALANLEYVRKEMLAALDRMNEERRWKEAYRNAFIEHFRTDCAIEKAEIEIDDRAQRIFEEGK